MGGPSVKSPVRKRTDEAFSGPWIANFTEGGDGCSVNHFIILTVAYAHERFDGTTIADLAEGLGGPFADHGIRIIQHKDQPLDGARISNSTKDLNHLLAYFLPVFIQRGKERLDSCRSDLEQDVIGCTANRRAFVTETTDQRTGLLSPHLNQGGRGMIVNTRIRHAHHEA